MVSQGLLTGTITLSRIAWLQFLSEIMEQESMTPSVLSLLCLQNHHHVDDFGQLLCQLGIKPRPLGKLLHQKHSPRQLIALRSRDWLRDSLSSSFLLSQKFASLQVRAVYGWGVAPKAFLLLSQCRVPRFSLIEFIFSTITTTLLSAFFLSETLSLLRDLCQKKLLHYILSQLHSIHHLEVGLWRTWEVIVPWRLCLHQWVNPLMDSYFDGIGM